MIQHSHITIPTFRGGLRTDIQPDQLPEDCTPDCLDMTFDFNTMKARPGDALFCNLPAGPSSAVALCEYHSPDVSTVVLQTRLVAIGTDGKVYATDAANQSFASYLTIGGETPLVVNTTRPRMAQFKDSLYIVDGDPAHGPRKVFGMDTTQYASVFYGSGVFGANGPAGIGQDAGGNLYVCDPSNHRIVKITSAGIVAGWYGSDGTTSQYHTTGTPHSGNGNGAFNSPMGIAVGSTYLIVADTGNNRIQKINLADGAFIWTASVYNTGYTLTAPYAVCIAPDGSVYTGDSASGGAGQANIVKYTDNGSSAVYAACSTMTSLVHTGIYYTLRAITCDATGAVYAVLHGVYTLIGQKGAVGRIESFAVQKFVGGAPTPFNHPAADIYWELPGATDITVNNTQVYVVANGVINIYGLDGSVVAKAKNPGVSYITISASGVWSLSHTSAGTIELTSVTLGLPSDYIELLDEVKPGTAPVVSAVAGNLGAAPYNICYTYLRKAAAFAATGSESPQSPTTTYVASETTGLSLTVSNDLAASLTSHDAIVIYMNGGALGNDFVQVLMITPPNPGTTTTVNITSIGEAGTPLQPYVQRPPKGVSLLMEWNGRMCYAAGDTLYISVWDDPDHITPIDIVNNPEVYGAWVRIGTDGSAITGMGKLGSYLVVLKQRGVWLVSGDPGTVTFSVQQISTSNGCSSHETIQQIDGGMLVWLDGAKVWGFTGQQFTEIGKPIESNLQAYPVGYSTRAFAVHDPANRYYELIMPEGVGGTSIIAGTAYVLHQREDQSLVWTKWDGQPTGCAIYAGKVTTPGRYGINRTERGIFLLGGDTSVALVDAQYYSKVFTAPSMGLRKSVVKLTIEYKTPPRYGAIQGFILTWGARGFVQEACDAVSFTINPHHTNTSELFVFEPWSVQDAVYYQVMLYMSVPGIEIANITLDVIPRGYLR